MGKQEFPPLRKGAWGKPRGVSPKRFWKTKFYKNARFRRLDAAEIAKSAQTASCVLRHGASSNAGAVTPVTFKTGVTAPARFFGFDARKIARTFHKAIPMVKLGSRACEATLNNLAHFLF